MKAFLLFTALFCSSLVFAQSKGNPTAKGIKVVYRDTTMVTNYRRIVYVLEGDGIVRAAKGYVKRTGRGSDQFIGFFIGGFTDRYYLANGKEINVEDIISVQ